MDDAVNGDSTGPLRNRPDVSLRLSAAEWGLLLILASMQFTHIVDFMIIMPLGPRYTVEMGLTPEQFGRMVSVYTISAAVASLFAARYLDRFDRKKALLWLYGGFTVTTLACAAAPTYGLLLVARTVTGAFGGVTAATILAIVGDAFPHARRGQAMGVLMYGFSLATIAGLPIGLILAEYFGWQAPFVGLGIMSAAMLVLGALVLPPFRGHLAEPVAAGGAPAEFAAGRKHSPALAERTASSGSTTAVRAFADKFPSQPSARAPGDAPPARSASRTVGRENESAWAVATDPNHVRAFLLMLALVASSFLIAPYVATYLVFNAGLPETDLKYVYLCGGLTTLLTLTLFGKFSDRYGKLPVFRVAALACLVPFLWITNLPPGAWMGSIILATTAMFVFTSGRMVPAMALITNSAAPRVRGSFMSLNAAVQHFGAGLATWIGGLILNKDEGEKGPLVGYSTIGLLASAAVLASVYLAGRLRPAVGGDLAPDADAVDPHHYPEPCTSITDCEGVIAG
jgi:predicted MFS family arabinose efflux permease